MKRIFLSVIFSVLLGGCALPTSVQVVSWAIDGISYLATEKSVADHGISLVTEQDCALWRVVKQEKICERYENSTTVVADANAATQNSSENSSEVIAVEGETEPTDTASVQVTSLDPALVLVNQVSPASSYSDETSPEKGAEIAALADFETAAGTPKTETASSKPKNAKHYSTGPIAGDFLAAWSSALKRNQNQAIDLNIMPKNKTDRKSTVNPVPSTLQVAGHTAGTLSSAWAQANGKPYRPVQWAYVSSPTPAHEPDWIEHDHNILAENVPETEPEAVEIPQVAELLPVSSPAPVIPQKIATEPVETGPFSEIEQRSKTPDQTAAKPVKNQILAASRSDQVGGAKSIYFVVASYSTPEHAITMLSQYRSLDIQLVVAQFDNQNVYRGIVGPFPISELDQPERRITAAGVQNAWAFRLNQQKWTFVYSAALGKQQATSY